MAKRIVMDGILFVPKKEVPNYDRKVSLIDNKDILVFIANTNGLNATVEEYNFNSGVDHDGDKFGYKFRCTLTSIDNDKQIDFEHISNFLKEYDLEFLGEACFYHA